MARETARFLDEQRVILREFAGVLGEYLDNTLAALACWQSRVHRRFNAAAAGFVQVSEIQRRELPRAKTPRLSGFANLGNHAIGDRVSRRMDALAGLVPTGPADQARIRLAKPDENGPRAYSGAYARGHRLQKCILIAARQRHARQFEERGRCFHDSPEEGLKRPFAVPPGEPLGKGRTAQPNKCGVDASRNAIAGLDRRCQFG